MKKIVICPGGFHPFHAGHYALYKAVEEKFPDADIYLAATNDTKTRPFPFVIKKKLAQLAGVNPNQFVQVKSPFKSEEITKNYNPEQDMLIFVRSEKDRTEQPKPGGTKKDGSPSYFQPYTNKSAAPFSKHAYIDYLPTVEFGPGIKSATEIRSSWPSLNDKQKLAMVMSLYPATQKNKKLASAAVKMLDAGIVRDQTPQELTESIILEGKGHLEHPEDLVFLEGIDGARSAAASPVQGYLDDGTQTQEGFVSQGLKFVDRMGFSRQNLAGRTPITEKLRETIEIVKAKLPNATPNQKVKMVGLLKESIDLLKKLKEDKKETTDSDVRIDSASANLTPDENNTLKRIQRMYPEAPDSLSALVKYIIHSIDQSDQEDHVHNQKLRDMEKSIKNLERDLKNAQRSDQPVKEAYSDDTEELNKNLRYSRSRDPVASDIRKHLGMTKPAVLAQADEWRVEQDEDGQVHLLDGEGTIRASFDYDIWEKLSSASNRAFNEATLINDPEQGHLIVPDGGMGTWDEKSLLSNLIRKFSSMAEMIKEKRYSNLYHSLYEAGVVENMLKALVQYENFKEKQGNRPIAKNKSIDLGENVIKENGYASQLDTSKLSTERLLKIGKKVGTINGKEVWKAESGSDMVYFLVTDDVVHALLGFSNGYLRNVLNITKKSIPVRELLGYIVHVEKQKINVSSQEGLTEDGLKWIIYLLKRPSGLIITDQHGNSITPESLYKEWEQARDNDVDGSTGIIISERKEFGDKIRENERRRHTDSLILPFILYDNNDYLLEK
jgi:hypothetical protein